MFYLVLIQSARRVSDNINWFGILFNSIQFNNILYSYWKGNLGLVNVNGADPFDPIIFPKISAMRSRNYLSVESE